MLDAFRRNPSGYVVDLGCGNGRNSRYLQKAVYNCEWKNQFRLFDKTPDAENAEHIDFEDMTKPLLPEGSGNVILCQYTMMFLSGAALGMLIDQINTIAAPGAMLVVELYENKREETRYDGVQETVLAGLPEWKPVHVIKDHFILQKRKDEHE